MSVRIRRALVVKTVKTPRRFYVGVTADIVPRIDDHNRGACTHTASRRPWLHIVIEFPDETHAAGFERYLKSGSGRAFAKRHFGE